jgi:hypothetical protein
MADYNPLGKARFPYNQDTDGAEITHFDAQNTTFEYHVGKTFQELLDLLLSKHKDYGPKNISDAPGGALNGLRVRMHDKLARINNLYEYMEDTNGFQPQHESLEDSFKDMANYAIIGLLVLRGEWDK